LGSGASKEYVALWNWARGVMNQPGACHGRSILPSRNERCALGCNVNSRTDSKRVVSASSDATSPYDKSGRAYRV
jgi:hypothetical protein